MALRRRARHATKENAMTKAEYLSRLESLLSCLPESQRAESLAFYEEMILDRMEEGLSEEEAVSTLSGDWLLRGPDDADDVFDEEMYA